MAVRPGGRIPASVRIIDVARLAGVSPQTVSNVVNGRGGYTEQTRATVMRAVEHTGYLPNRAARQLRTRRAKLIAFCLEGRNLDARNPFTLWLLRAIVDTAHPSGHRVVVFTCETDDVAQFEAWARAGDADAYVFANVTPGDPRTAVLTRLGLPFAVMGRTLPSEPQTWVDVDNRSSIAAMVDYLVAKGHRRFGFVGGEGTRHWNVERREGTRDRLAEHGIALPDRSVLVGELSAVASGLDELMTSPTRPSALVCSSDTLAVLAGTRARAHGLHVGRDLAVSGFDGGMLDWVLDPPLTTVRIPVAAVAEAIMTRLLRELASGPTGDPGQFVTTELVVGGSA